MGSSPEVDPVLSEYLPVELLNIVLKATGSEFLEAISRAALITECTERIFLLYETLIPEIATRWIRVDFFSSRTLSQDIAILRSFGAIFPFARYTRPIITTFIIDSRFDVRVQNANDGDLRQLLLALFRLLSTDNVGISDVVKPTFLSRFLSHQSRVVRFLAIQCLCIVMRFADALETKLIAAHVDDGQVNMVIEGTWEGRTIDYRLLKLFEEKRWLDLERDVKQARAMVRESSNLHNPRYNNADLSRMTAGFGCVPVPRGAPLQVHSTMFVETATAVHNLESLGRSLLDQKPILVIGNGGSGKTMLVREAARLLNQSSSMITLHLNEQTDAKSLLGVYTSSTSGESFIWQPGVLTKAVQQGRWVVIEDIDRAPSEVLGVLRPIIETGELFLPSRKEKVRPKEGFRVFATIKTSSKTGKGNLGRHAWLSNERLWSTVQVESYPSDEIQELLRHRYPSIIPLISGILRAHEAVCNAYSDDPSFRAVQGRLPSLRDLLKWCRRTHQRIESLELDLSANGMPEQTRIDIFKDGVDCYAALHADVNAYTAITQCLAQAMNISPQQIEHVLSSQISNVIESKSQVSVGRSTLPKIETRRPASSKKANFAMTTQAKKTMDSIAAGTSYSEPLLLVGETGVGKTTQVQHIANLVNQQLTVVNLSQQSEAADLLGGLKPITTRSLIIPLVDQFSILFDDTFSSKRNEKFQIAITKAINKDNWARLVLLWKEAVQMAENSLKKPFEAVETEEEGQSAKRRRLASKYGPLRDRWAEFASKLNHIQAQIERGDKNHTFAFVEGRLVQAVRSGEWLLLDEINLASADTLDHIVGLLGNGEDQKPSLLLAEAGNIEQISAHPNFRIFAAMNPATDTGKKDLAPGVRSRFTEIYVQPGDDDLDDLVKIIETYLGALLSSDKRAASDLAKAYLQLKTLNSEHKLTDGAGDVPHFSIRSLVRCLLYVIQHSASHGLRRSMYEGFAMSFFTVLSIASEKLASPLLINHLLANVRNVKSFLAQQPKITLVDSEYVAFRHHLVRKGFNSPDSQPHYIRTPSVERNLINLARATSMRRFPILLQGPTSAGKTSMVEFLAKFTGNHFVRVNNHEHTDLQEYLGSYASGDDGKLEFREGVLVEALRKGHWIVLDELNLAPSDVLEALNRLLDDNRELLIPESQEIVRPHPNFMLFATQNPAGLYGGRKRFSRAFRNRFLELHFDDIPEDELEVILRERAQIAPSFCTQIVQVYKKLSLQRQSTRLFESRNSFATLRDLFRWAARPVDDRQQLARHGFMLLAERVRDPAERLLVKNTIEETLKVKIEEDSLYGLNAVPQNVSSNGNVVWTPAMRRLFVLVSQALRSNEPVLLVGETGCGKTQICQTVAQAFERQLSIYNAHSNTETGDLIGSQRPVRQRSELASAVLNSFSQLHSINGATASIENENIDELIKSFDKMDTSGLEPDIVERTRQCIIAYQSLFAWSDGSLVRSMKAGEHFLLDEISLADDSVLERLNSVLEPSRTILLAEKGSRDNLVIANVDFQFLATMNPGGDYGKRELSAALRNRLTEIWVPPLSQGDDILPILRARLGEKYERFAQPMLDFAIWFKQTMQNSSNSTIPLRSLLAWSEFMRKLSHLNPDVAFVHGASMVYIDSLGANPAGLTNSLAGDVHAARMVCLTELQNSTSIDVLSLHREVPRLQLQPTEARIGDFSLPRSSAAGEVTDLVFDAPTTLRNTMRIVRALQMYRPILLEGSPGVGKTAIVTALAATVGKALTRINLSDQTDLMDLFGADAPSENEKLGRFSWRDGPLLQAMQSGSWVLLDEMNLASQSVLEGLNSCLDHRHEVYIAELDKSFTCHPEFTLFAAQNPHHQGGGRKGLPASFVNRFTVVYADSFEHEDLMLICKRTRPEVLEEQLSTIINVISNGHELISRSPTTSVGGPWELNLRDVNRWLDLMQAYTTLPPSHHFESTITQRFRSSPATALLTRLRDEYLSTGTNLTMYHNISTELFQLGTSFIERDAQVQPVPMYSMLDVKHLPYAKSVMTAVNNRWPVVLVGPSGCGKTTLIRHIAAMSGARLVEFSMNNDIDTMDLIGGFEQYDVRRDILAVQKEICEYLMRIICDKIVDVANRDDKAIMVALYEKCSSTDIDFSALIQATTRLIPLAEIFQSLHTKLMDLASKSSGSRFVWNDGILIDALQEGSWLVLDNANLCNPSVLDRLNSLLEPNGVLAVSEQHTAGDKERVIRPHPRFRIFLTMDPKYGELSRAMRNRSLELFMNIDTEASNHSVVPTYTASSNIYRSRHLVQYIHHMQGQSAALPQLAPLVAMLSEDDQRKLTGQMINFVKDTDLTIPILDVMESFSYIRLPGEVWQRISATFTATAGSLSQLRKVNWQDQPQSFVLNDAMLGLVKGGVEFDQIITHARQYFVELTRARLIQRLDATRKRAETVPKYQRTILQHSFMSTHGGRKVTNAEKIPNIDNFLSKIINEARYAGELFRTTHEAVVGTHIILDLAKDMLELFNKPSIDQDVFQAYLQIAYDVLQNTPSNELNLRRVMNEALRSFDKQFVLESGQSLHRMWLRWKPVTPTTYEQLEAQTTIESLILKFDQLAKQLPQRRAALALIRSQLCSASKYISEDNDPTGTIATFTQAVEALAQQKTMQMVQKGHFTSVFEWALRKLVNQGRNISELDFQRLSLFTESLPFILDQSPSSISNTMHRVAYLNSGELHDSAVASARLSADLASVQSESLSSIAYIQEELKELASTISSNASVLLADDIRPMIENVCEMIGAVMLCHNDLLTIEARACMNPDKQVDVRRLARLGIGALEAIQNEQVGYFEKIYTTFLLPVIVTLAGTSSLTSYSVGACLVNVSIACLQLFVPDKAFDPSVYPRVINHRHHMRAAELQKQITLYRGFQQGFTGETHSTAISIFEEDLKELGEAPPSIVVVRPTKSELPAIQHEFSTVLKNILGANQLDTLLPCLSSPNRNSEGIGKACEGVQILVSRVVDRLSRLNRAYDDIVKPVAWLLESLSLGTKLISRKRASGTSVRGTFDLSTTPLLGASPDSIVRHELRALIRRKHIDTCWLEQIRFKAHVEKDINRSQLTSTMHFLSLTDALYIEWKTRLTKDQAEAESKSRYYAYRGEDDAAEEIDEFELASMFPTYENDDTADQSTGDSHYDARSIGMKTAQIHHGLFDIGDVSENLRDRILRNLAHLSNKNVETDVSGADSMMAGIFLQLQDAMHIMEKQDTAKDINIYTDSDVVESRKLVDLVQRIRVRFTEIHEQWPEHAVPAEVLSYSDELLGFKINEPIAKLLTKTEKLFEIVTQWQSVASREWSAVNLMEELTSKLIHWRRLELSSWSRLLEIERKKSEEDANAWYFIAYEAVLYNSRLVVDQNGDVATYCQELAGTLEEFLRTTTLGQFANRLKLLTTFERTLAVILAEDVRLSHIVDCIRAVLFHYNRYAAGIQQALDAGRTKLEKDVIEQIKLASWKDTNIASLRLSAKKSHNKLFRIVRKYRTLLAQPISSFKSADIDLTAAPIEQNQLPAPQLSSGHLDLALQKCTVEIQGWNLRPERLTKPLGAAMTMRKLYTDHTTGINAFEQIASFRNEIVSTATELRKETPSTLTEDNTSLVRHLKERKRRLLAETMKSVTQMGIKRNLGTNELSKQATVATVLACSPDIDANMDGFTADAANTAFHEALDNMPGVRKAAIEHSDELTEGEVRRGIGLLEGLLSVKISQRTSLATTTSQLRSLDTMLDSVKSMQSTDTNKALHVQDGLSSTKEWVEKSVAWLPQILEAACQVLMFQSTQGSFNVTDLLNRLQQEMKQLALWKSQLQTLTKLPNGLINTAEVETIRAIETGFHDFGKFIEQWQDQETNIEYLLQQIVPWTRPFGATSVYANGVTQTSIEETDTKLRRLLDSIFVALQNVAAIQSKHPDSAEVQGWLSKVDNNFVDAVKLMHLVEISNQLTQALKALRHLPEDRLELGISLFGVATPVIEQYVLIAKDMYQVQLKTHLETCKLSVFLTKTFLSLASEGFCSPREPSKGDEQSGKLESGTGLGEGEGAEDISKDIGEDEDLSELAQTNAEKEDGDQEMDKQKDAVDMGADDLEGATGSGDEGSDDEKDEKSGSDDEDAMSEEAGSVDDLDPSAVDEKLWDDVKNEAEKDDKEMKGDKQKGQKSDEQTAKEDGAKEEGDEEMEGIDEAEGDEENDDNEGQGRPEAENLDPHLQEEEALELPEEMQLTGEEEGKDGEVSDDGMDDMSDIDKLDQPMPEEVDDVDKDLEEQKDGEISENEDGDEEDENVEGQAQDDEIVEDQPDDNNEEKQEDLDTRDNEMQYDLDDNEGGDTGTANQRDDADQNQEQDAPGQNEKEDVVNEQQTQTGKASDQQQTGDASKGTLEQGAGRENEQRQNQDDALKNLADILEQYHQRREILTASEERKQGELDQDVDMADADFEHVGENEQDADTQALGAASADQVQKLDESKAIEEKDADADGDLPMPEGQEKVDQERQETLAERFSRLQSQPRPPKETGAGGLSRDNKIDRSKPQSAIDDQLDDIDVEEDPLPIDQIQLNIISTPPTTDSDASSLWAHCSTRTHNLSLQLTEQLRLILAPTTATKLRGDFRTGKRLNIKRIIPYIASGYKRDKIWMRRSVPSKRNYQIMIAVDDSKSMSESGADILALETVALLCKSLSTLEVGELAVIGFGDEDHIRIAHPFTRPFSGAESGVEVFKSFSFQQRGTDVRRLLRQSISLFENTTSSDDDLWRLQLIVSDGHCSDHESIRRLVREAQEKKIVIVFVVVDPGPDSIVDLKEAVFERVDPNDAKSEMRVVTRRYLEGFPFGYYVVVREVEDLPGVLARVLKGWFESVVNVG